MPIITEFAPDEKRKAVFKECMDNYSVGEVTKTRIGLVLNGQTT